MTREQIEALLIVEDGVPYANAHRLVRLHDAGQRADIAKLTAEVVWQNERHQQYVALTEQEIERLRAVNSDLQQSIQYAKNEVRKLEMLLDEQA